MRMHIYLTDYNPVTHRSSWDEGGEQLKSIWLDTSSGKLCLQYRR